MFGTSTSNTFGAAKPAFGSAPLGKPLFGSTSQQSTPSLFGGGTTTGANTTGGGGLFGGGTTSTFGKPVTTTTGFGAPAAGTTSTSFNFTSKPPGALFGPAGQAPPPQIIDPLVQALQQSEPLLKSLLQPELYGDDRDRVIAKMNQLASALGVGRGFYKKDQQPVEYKMDGPFQRFRAATYNQTAEQLTDQDGVVALVMRCAASNFEKPENRQKFLDVMFTILGNDTNKRPHIYGIRELPDGQCEMCIYVTATNGMRYGSRDLCAHLNQHNEKTQQLTNQLGLSGPVTTRVRMTPDQIREFEQRVPAGFDSQFWQQWVLENPDREHLVPVPIRGTPHLAERIKLQKAEVDAYNQVLDALSVRLVRSESDLGAARRRLIKAREAYSKLSLRVLRIIVVQHFSQRVGQHINEDEDRLRGIGADLARLINAPRGIKKLVVEQQARLEDLLDPAKGRGEKAFSDGIESLSEPQLTELRRALACITEGLEDMQKELNNDVQDIVIMENGLKEF